MITIEAIKSLRASTGAGMMNCKKALQKAQGDVEKALRILRVKGLAKSLSRASRSASQGAVLLKVSEDNTMAALLEINCETDFVAGSDPFQKILQECLKSPLSFWVDKETFLKYESHHRSMDAMIKEQGVAMGENIFLRRIALLAPRDAYVVSYLHGVKSPGVGSVAVVLSVKGDKSMASKVRKVAMHIASSKPLAVRADHLHADIIEEERTIARQQAEEAGKPTHIIEKIVEGRVAKLIKGCCLLEQFFIFQPDKTVQDVLTLWNKDAVEPLELLAFHCFALGLYER